MSGIADAFKKLGTRLKKRDQVPLDSASGSKAPRVYEIGELIHGRYEVVKSLTGGMGVVYLCLDKQQDVPVALKTFKPEYLSDPDAVDRFLRESTTWVNLGRHPHIVRAYRVECGGNQTDVYLVLEWVAQEEGKQNASLRAVLTPGRPLPADRALLFGIHIARGMRHAVDKIPGFVHRDLKPENVLVARDGNAKVTDFGLATVVLNHDDRQAARQAPGAFALGRTQLTGDGIVGTPLYMAPEQWTGSLLDVRTDIYAFGCILFEMLTGLLAVNGRTLSEVRSAHLAGKIHPPPSLRGGLWAVLTRCLSTRQEGRFENWEQVEAALIKLYKDTTGENPAEEINAMGEVQAERLSAAMSLSAIGATYLDLGKYGAAEQYFRQQIQAGTEENDPRLLCWGQINLARVLSRTTGPEAAVKLLDEANALVTRSGRGYWQMEALGTLGTMYLETNQALVRAKAFECMDRALSMADAFDDYEKKTILLSARIVMHHKLGDANGALSATLQLATVAEKCGDKKTQLSALHSMGVISYDLGRLADAEKYNQQALSLARQAKDEATEASCLDGLGLIKRVHGLNTEAADLHSRAASIYERLGNRNSEALALAHLGLVYGSTGDFAQARTYYERCLAITRQTGDRALEGKTVSSIGTILARQGRPSEAIPYFELGMKIAREAGDRRGEAQALGNLGTAYLDLKQPNRGIPLLTQDLSLTREMGDSRGEMTVLVSLANAYASLNQTGLAADYYRRAMQIADGAGDVAAISMIATNTAIFTLSQGDPKQALQYAQRALQISTLRGDFASVQRAQQLIAHIRRYM